jgi:hypothetical protein
MAERETDPKDQLRQGLLRLAGTVLVIGLIALWLSSGGTAPSTSVGAVKAPSEGAAPTPASMAGPKFEA